MSAIDPDQLARLFDDHAGALALYARQWCDANGAEDVVQEAFVALARQRHRPDRLVPWLYRVVRNGALDFARGAARRRRRESIVSSREAWFAPSDDRLDAQAATRALTELDSDCREVIVARLWGGLAFDEVARLQGCSLATAHRRYHQGLARLHERLGEPCLSSTQNVIRS